MATVAEVTKAWVEFKPRVPLSFLVAALKAAGRIR